MNSVRLSPKVSYRLWRPIFIAASRSSSDVASYPLTQKSCMAASSARSRSNALGRATDRKLARFGLFSQIHRVSSCGDGGGESRRRGLQQSIVEVEHPRGDGGPIETGRRLSTGLRTPAAQDRIREQLVG